MAIPSRARARVRWCAIARDEGANVADGVFHHLRSGFDAIEVWINGTTDPSEEIPRRLGSRDPRVTYRVVDERLDECLDRGRDFQHEACARMAAGTRADGLTHAAVSP